MPIILSASYTDFTYRNGVLKTPGLYSAISRSVVLQGLGYDILPMRHGSPTRTTSGSLHNGSTSSVAWSNPNVLRFEDRGDGYGAFALLEGSRTNGAIYSENYSVANWLQISSTKFSESYQTPFGDTRTMVYVSASNLGGRLQQTTTTPWGGNDTTASISFFCRNHENDSFKAIQVGALGKDSTIRTSSDIQINGAWRRVDAALSNGSGSSGSLIYTPAFADGADAAWIMMPFMGQLEVSATFPSSYIYVPSNVSQTRGADTLLFTASNPVHATTIAEMAGDGFEFDVYPIMSSQELMNAGTTAYTLVDMYAGSGSVGTNGFGIRYAGGSSLYARMVVGGAQLVISNNLTWSRHQKLTFKVEPLAGRLTVAGATSGNGTTTGTTGSFPQQAVYLNANNNGTSAFFGRYSNIRRLQKTAPATPSHVLIPLRDGTFTRTTSGSYYNGALSTIAWANPNVLRYENRGDGYGYIALIEGARTNTFNYSRNLSQNANRTTTNYTTSYTVSPDGILSGTRYVAAAGQYSDFSTVTAVSGTTYAYSAFVRSTSGSVNWQGSFGTSTGSYAITASINESWYRYDRAQLDDGGTSGIIPIDARNWTSIGGQAAQTIDAIVDMGQIEIGSFPSSFIETATTTDVARGSDILSFPSGTYPREIIGTQGFEVKIYPLASSDEIIRSYPGTQTYGIMAFESGNNFFRFLNSNGTNVRLQYFQVTVGERVVTDGITFGRNQELAIGFYPNSGSGVPRIIVSGATTGNGTYSGSAITYIPTGTMYIGNTFGTQNFLFGRITDIYRSGTLGL